ncbi:MAG: NAD(P)H-hydrate dehydratase [Anaerolineales bacterium]|nr:NAD(P)H-hydrate dehydratase [Anaerolineales bacterium]
MKLVTAPQMRAIEKEADSKGVSYAQLMQNAGRGFAEIVHALGQENGWDEVTGLVGPGNNGGDALVALAWLAEAGWRTHAYLVNRKQKGDELIAQYLSLGGELAESLNDENNESLATLLNQSDVLVDGLLGTGIKLPLKKEAAQVLGEINFILSDLELPPFVVAVDCPSGVDCDTGVAADETIPADLTITMAAAKQGLLKLPAFEYVGELQVVDIGLPEKMDSWIDIKTEAADWDMVAALLPERNPASHKGTFGTAFVVAGSTSYTGAALLAGKAAYRIGAGLVTLAVPEPLHAALAGHIPEATWVLLPHENGFISDHASDNVLQNLQMLPSPSSAAWTVLQNLERATAFLIGPGLGDKLSTRAFIEDLIPSLKIPMVVDADGLRHLAEIGDWHKKIIAPAVLTPHPGEMSVLTGLPKEEIQSDREGIAIKYANKWGHVVVLKGAFTVIASPSGQCTVIPVATPALAHAGTGDVLAGLIVGLRAQGLEGFDAAVAGAFIHAQAGLLAAETLGTTASVLASDILEVIPEVLAGLE